MAFMRGAIPTPRHILAMAIPHRTFPGVPVSPSVIPKQLNMWGNANYGDCVTAEEFAAKAMYSVMLGLSELYMPESLAISWAQQNGYLNGANLPPVMQSMANPGVSFNGTTYTDGSPTAVDYTNWDNLCSAISQGPVKLGIAADQLSNTNAGQANGWYGSGWTNDTNEDHCVGAWLFGTLAQLFSILGVPLPSGASPSARGIGVYTWSTVGVVNFDDGSLTNVTGEAWLRSPTTPQEEPAPNPTPTPAPPLVVTVPATAVWADKASGNVHVPIPTWSQTTNYANTLIVIDPDTMQVSVPGTGWKNV